MGQRLMRRPPKFVHGFIDRHGKARFYFRRPGYKRAPLPACHGRPSSWRRTSWQWLAIAGDRASPD